MIKLLKGLFCAIRLENSSDTRNGDARLTKKKKKHTGRCGICLVDIVAMGLEKTGEFRAAVRKKQK